MTDNNIHTHGTSNSDYFEWIKELKNRFSHLQIKAAVAVNSALIEFYWNLGKDISNRLADNKYGSQFYNQLSKDLCHALPNVKGFSPTNLKYALYFYELYYQIVENRPQVVDKLNRQQLVDDLNVSTLYCLQLNKLRQN